MPPLFAAIAVADHVPVVTVPTVTIDALPAMGENVDDNDVPPTVGIAVDSKAAVHTFVALAPVAPIEPVSVRSDTPSAKVPETFAEPLKFCPQIVRVVVRVAAEPVVLWLSVGNVQLVSVPLLGVPNAPPFTTKAPAVPTLTARAVATPVPGVIPAQVVRSAS